MSSNTYIEHLSVTQKARDLVREVYRATKEHKSDFEDCGLATQMHRAAICVMQSLDDGFSQPTAPDFHRCLAMAKGSCAEIRSQLHMALDIGYISPDEFARLMESATDIAHLLSGLRSPVGEMRYPEPVG